MKKGQSKTFKSQEDFEKSEGKITGQVTLGKREMKKHSPLILPLSIRKCRDDDFDLINGDEEAIYMGIDPNIAEPIVHCVNLFPKLVGIAYAYKALIESDYEIPGEKIAHVMKKEYDEVCRLIKRIEDSI